MAFTMFTARPPANIQVYFSSALRLLPPAIGVRIDDRYIYLMFSVINKGTDLEQGIMNI